MEQSSVRVRESFGESADFLVSVVDAVADDQWDQPALGEWTVAQLAVHASRGASTVSAYADEDAELTLHSAAEYYSTALAIEGVHGAVASRAVEQAEQVEGPVAQYVREAVSGAEEVLTRIPADRVLGTVAGGIRLIDYLPTRIVELVVHTLDLADAIGAEVTVPRRAMAITLETLGDLAADRPDLLDPALLVRALTGRGTLPPDANLLG